LKPILPFRLPRFYVFIIVLVVLFTALNLFILGFGRNLFVYFQAIWSWSGILLMALIGSMIIGMFLSYRLLAYREFTPFEREMMEMRLEVAECRQMLNEMKERLEGQSPEVHSGREGEGGADGVDARKEEGG